MGVGENVREFIAIVFLLLGALFGMIIMSFIFTNLGPDSTGLTVDDAGYNQSVAIQNNSLTAIVNYSDQAGTQFSTVGIAITLLILIALFLVFWQIFISNKKGKDGGSGISSGGNFG